MQQVTKHRERMQQTEGAISFSHYYQAGRWRCSLSPSGAHHWLIDGNGVGQCKYCGERREFAKSQVPAYECADDTGWDSRRSSENRLRELLPIA
jgi:hypothetical protein